MCMKTNKKNLLSQRQIIEKKIKPWLSLRAEAIPPAGWMKAIRGALGINTRQLADLIGVSHSAITQLEKREPQKKVTLEMIEKVAESMECRFIYAIVPKSPHKNLEEIIDQRAVLLASDLFREVEHTMRLEAQGTAKNDSNKRIEQLAFELKAKMDTRIWNKKQKSKKAEIQ